MYDRYDIIQEADIARAVVERFEASKRQTRHSTTSRTSSVVLQHWPGSSAGSSGLKRRGGLCSPLVLWSAQSFQDFI
jgi:hypothetical protein